MASAADQGGEPETSASEGPRAAGPRPARRRRRALAEWAITLLAALLLASGIRAFVFEDFSIPTGSMVPTLDVGDRIFVQKAFFTWHDVRQGDIVVFTRPPRDTDCGGTDESDLVKRVIALPGQTIYSSGNDIYVDGRRLQEPYLPRIDPLGPPIPGATRQVPFHVPPGEFYVMGDNRQISCDSRYWGPIKGTSIVGKAVLVWWRDGHPDVHAF
jgi:signal peptidase I